MTRCRHLLPAMVMLALIAPGVGPGALAAEHLVETIGAWILECGKTEAGGRECQVRNDEGGKAALEQSRLLQITLHQGKTEADALIRVADLELAPRLTVELAYGNATSEIDGVGRRGRLAARFALQKQELAGLAAADAIHVRFVDKAGQAHDVGFPTSGLGEALAIAGDHL